MHLELTACQLESGRRMFREHRMLLSKACYRFTSLSEQDTAESAVHLKEHKAMKRKTPVGTLKDKLPPSCRVSHSLSLSNEFHCLQTRADYREANESNRN